MKVDRTTGRVSGAPFVASPNHDARPDSGEPELLVIHGISLPPGQYGGPHIEALFTNSLDPDGHPYFKDIAHLRVSAHLLVRRNGTVVQFVPLQMRAWHAGESQFRGRGACNDFSVGIEMEGSDDEDYAHCQYVVLAKLYVALSWAYPDIASNPVVGHSDIAPGRKTDPGAFFDWWRFSRLVREFGGEMAPRAEFDRSIA